MEHHTKATLLAVLEANGFSRRDLQEMMGDLSLVDRVALQLLPQQVDYSFYADDIVDVTTGRTRAEVAAIEAYKHAVAFLELKRKRDNVPLPNFNYLRECRAAVVELVRLRRLKALIDSGDATPEQEADYNLNNLLAWDKAEKLANA